MAKQKTYLGVWRSDQAEAKYRMKEAALWDRARRRPEAIDVPTRFGPTRTYRWAGGGEPIVFLHGMSDSAVRWIPYAEALGEHDIYAIDIMGEVGHSRPEVGFTSAADYGTWVGEALAELGITRPHMVGHSLGGYIAFSHAMAAGHVASLTGFDPVGVVDLKLARLMTWSVRCGMAAYAPAAMRRRLADRLRQPLLADEEAMAALMLSARGHPVKVPPCPVFTDAELRSITAPVQVLAGADFRGFDAPRLVDRINTEIRHGEARLIPEAGHVFPVSHLDDCVAAIRRSLAERAVGS